MAASISVLIVSKGHFYDHDALQAMFAAMQGIDTTLVEHPAAQVILQPEHIDAYDAVFFYDMCGIPGAGLHHDLADAAGQPTPEYAASIAALLEAGKGLVLANHATVSWPNWPLWRDITGTSFMLREGELRGQRVPGSGYRGGHGPLANAAVHLQPAQAHPVVEGLEDGFEITDELYLKTDLYGTNVTPLMRADYDFNRTNFTAPPLASAEEQASWDHPDGSNLVVWANVCGNSPIVATDIGDGPLAFSNSNFRRLLQNALLWVTSPAAKAWVRSQS